MLAFNENSTTHKVLVLGNIHARAIEILSEFSEVVVIPEPPQKEDIIAVVGSADAILHKFGHINADVMSEQQHLKIIARHGVGLDLLDLDSIRAHNVPVTITADANSNAVAETTIGLMISALRHFSAAENMLKNEKRWQRETLLGRELRDLTVGVIGFGRIGQLVAKYLDAFGCNLLVYDKNEAFVTGRKFRFSSLDEIYEQSEAITLHCPLTEETHHLINAQTLNRMRADCMVVNTSRGGLIDTLALVDAINTGKIAGAAIDVFEEEPPQYDHKVFSCKNVLTTPHIAAMTRSAQLNMAVNAALEIRGVLVDKTKPKITV